MFDEYTAKHEIQKHILAVLLGQKYARFRDMRPPEVDTNLYTYHLKLLQSRGFVHKTDQGYTLATTGLLYADRVDTGALEERRQPNIVAMFVIQNGNGDVLLQRRGRQPYLDLWALPYGKLYIEDESVGAAAQRMLRGKLGCVSDINLRRAGDCYIRATSQQEVVMSTLAHVFYAETEDSLAADDLRWARPHRLGDYDLAPAVEQIITRTFFRDPYFFEEYSQELTI